MKLVISSNHVYPGYGGALNANHLKNKALDWNTNINIKNFLISRNDPNNPTGVMLETQLGSTLGGANCPPDGFFDNNANELIADCWPTMFPETWIGALAPFELGTINVFGIGIVPRLVEGDIYMNPRIRIGGSYYNTLILADDMPGYRRCINEGNHLISADWVLLHEVGHLLGLADGGRAIMDGEIPECRDRDSIRNNDFSNLEDIYVPATQRLSITSPSDDANYFLNQDIPFGAIVSQLTKGLISGGAGADLTWESSINGEFGSGSSFSFDGLAGGTHEITVRDALDDGVRIDAITVNVLTQGNTFFGDLAHPIPCERLVGTNQCTLLISETIRSGSPCSSVISHSVVARNESTMQTYPIVQPDYGLSGLGPTLCEDLTDYYFTTAVIIDTPDQFVPLQFVHEYYDHNVLTFINDIRGGVPIVDPVIVFAPEQTCIADSGSGLCSITVSWSEQYFASDSALYIRPFGQPWQFLGSMGTTTGSLTTQEIVGLAAAEIAVFQYSHDVDRSPNPAFVPVIQAPAGLMAGPFQVQAVIPDNYDLLNDPDGNGRSNDDLSSEASSYVGAVQNHNFHDAGDIDWITYFSNASRITIETTGLSASADTCIRLFRSNKSATGTSGVALAEDCDGGVGQASKIVYDQLDDYVYYVEIWNEGGNGGLETEYTVSVAASPLPIASDAWDNTGDPDQNGFADDDDAGRATSYAGATQAHNFHDAGDIDWIFYFSNAARITIETSGLGAGADTCLYLYRSNATATGVSGSPVASDCDAGIGESSRIVFDQLDDYVYYVKVWNQSGNGGDDTQYTLAITPSPLPVAPDTWDTTGDPDGNGYADDDVAGRATSYAGVTQAHNFHDAGDIDWIFYFSNSARITIETSGLGNGADTCLYLYRSNATATGVSGSPVASDCDGGVGEGSRIVFDQMDNYVYYVKVWNQTGIGGDGTQYTLAITSSPLPVAPDTWDTIGDPDGNGNTDDDIAGRATSYTGVTQVHNFHDAGDRDWVLYYSLAGTINIETSQLGPNADTCIRLYRSNPTATGVSGGVIASNCDYMGTPASKIVFNQPDDYVYYVEVYNQTNVGGSGTSHILSIEMQ